MKTYRYFKGLFLLCIFSFYCVTMYAQDGALQVTGSVVNEKGKAVEFATIVVAGTQQGTTTDNKGNFAITAPKNGTLIITSIGYDPFRVDVQSKMAVVLRSTANNLNDVVVIGYGTQRRQELTGSVATVTEKDFQEGTITTPEQLIAGKVAGVSITSNGGSTGAGSVIRIRGGASLNASNDPLIVIDGVPLQQDLSISGNANPLSLINPNDIESFTILKDAASTAIYGSRASNGVIIITTKKGRRGRAVISFSTQTSVSTIAKRADVLTADEFRNYVDSFGANKIINGAPVASYLGTANTDWQKQIFQSALSTDNNLSIAGALKNLPYRLSIGYLNQDGILKTDHLQRYSGAISLSPMLFDKHLKIDINLKGALSDTRFANGGAISSAVYFDPTQPVYDPTSPYGGYYEWSSSGTLNKLAPRNPLALLNLYHNTSTTARSYGNVQFDYKVHFLPDLHINLNLGYDMAKGDGNVDVPAYAAQNFLDSGQKNQYSNRVNNKVAEFYLNYIKDLKSIKSNINLTAGYGYYDNITTNYSFYSFRANGDTIPGSKPTYLVDKPENTLLSYYARLIYTYKDRYILAASIRTDGSSRFYNGTPWGTFPSIAATWRINKEPFLANAQKLSDLKLRVSYGITGNQVIGNNYGTLAVYSLGGNSSQVQFGNNFYNQGTPAPYDNTLKWEQTAASNIGIDFGFFKNRITGSVDAYYKKTSNLLNYVPLPGGSNFTSYITTNVGNMDDKGIELLLNASIVRTKNISWDANFNISLNNFKITKLTLTDNPTYQGTIANDYQINSVGYTPDAFYVYKQVYDKNGKPIEGVYADLNGDGQINVSDRYRYKSPFPKYVMGFSTQFGYKKWSLSTVLRANIGNYMYNNLAAGAAQSNSFNSLGYLANSLSELTVSNFTANVPQSDYYIQNASFLKMDNLTLAYNVGKVWHNKLGIRINATCQNVFTITKYTGIDPEIYGGIDNALYPRPRIFGLGVNLLF